MFGYSPNRSSLRSLRVLGIFALVSALACAAVAAAPMPALHAPKPRVRPISVPLLFEANHGQTDSRALFLTRNSGYVLFLTSDGARLRAARRGGEAGVLDLRLLGAKAVVPQGVARAAAHANYLVGANPRAWRRDVPEYRRVLYSGIYPGIDLVYYGRASQLEYDFDVAPGARPEAIRLALSGATQTTLSPSGDLQLQIGALRFALMKPVAYQIINGRRQFVAARYRRAGNTIGFALGAYDHSRALVIDPVLSFATFLGGTGVDQANAVAADSSGNAYLAGFTLSTDFPVTTGVVQGAAAGGFDVFVSEIDPTGAKLIFSTYLGGASDDEASAVAVDGSGDVFVAGFTNSSNFPVTTGAFQTVAAGGKDGFLAELAPGGASLKYSTYLGGTSDDEINALALDSAGHPWVAGDTISSAFPVTTGAQQATSGGGQDAFVAKIVPSGAGAADLAYSTFLGGSGSDKATGIGLDGSGNVYATGFTSSTNFPVTAAAEQTTFGGKFDAFVVKYTSGGAIQYATYLGGAGDDEANAIAVDVAGDAFITGFTDSTNFPTSPGAYRTAPIGPSDVFVSELNRSGSALVYSTYVGGTASDVGTGIALDASGAAYVAGYTASSDFPTTASAVSTTLAGNDDAFLFKLNLIGTQLDFSTFLGGSQLDQANAVTIDAGGDIFVAGNTGSQDFPVTTGALQTAPASSQDAFLTKFISAAVGTFAPNPLSFAAQSVSTTSSAEVVQFTNSGELNLTISSIATTGPFAETNNCPATLIPNASCNISVTFSPTTTGAATGTLVVTDNAPGGSQSMALNGTGGDFSLSVTPTQAQITAGSTTSYQLTVTPANGYTQVVTLTCTGAPTGATCTPSPTSVTMNGTSASNATYTVTTSAGFLAPGPWDAPQSPWWYALLGLSLLALVWMLRRGLAPSRRRRWAITAALGLTLMSLAWLGCGSSSSSAGPKTPPGNYSLTLTATAGSTSHNVQVTLTVN